MDKPFIKLVSFAPQSSSSLNTFSRASQVTKMMLPIQRDAGSAPLLLGLALCTGGAGDIQTPLHALQKQIAHCIDLAAPGTHTGGTFPQDRGISLPDTPPSQWVPVLHSLHPCCCAAQLSCKYTVPAPKLTNRAGLSRFEG